MVIRAARVLASVLMRATARQSAALRRNFSARSGMCALYAAQTPQDRIGSALCNRALGSRPEQLYELIGDKTVAVRPAERAFRSDGRNRHHRPGPHSRVSARRRPALVARTPGIVLSAASEADVRAPGSDPKLL